MICFFDEAECSRDSLHYLSLLVEGAGFDAVVCDAELLDAALSEPLGDAAGFSLELPSAFASPGDAFDPLFLA